MRKCVLFCFVWMLAVLAPGALARAYGGQVQVEREIVQSSREDGREFTLTARVWTEDPLGPREPGRVLVADGGREELAPALARLAAEAEREEGPVCLVILAGEGEAPAGEEGLKMQRSVQRVRERGGQSFVCGGDGWQVLASAPAEGHFFPLGEEEACREAARKQAEGAYEVAIREVVDGRFTLTVEERERLKEEGAKVRAVGDNWVIEWLAEMPRGREEAWAGQWTVEAKEGFLGGNGVAVSGGGSGVFLEGRLVRAMPESLANVGVKLRIRDAEARVFLGETVPTALGGQALEEWMAGWGEELDLYWEDVGTTEQLGRLKPWQSTVYTLRAVFTPKGNGAGAAGPPVGAVSAEGQYEVRVLPGVLQVRVEGDGLSRGDRLPLRVEGGGQVANLTARAEADPQGGGLVLGASLGGLPYGKYTVTPLGAVGGSLLPAQECLLGVCREDDTVDVARRFGVVKFTAGGES